MTGTPALEDYEQRIVDCVESDGCFVTGVFDPEANEPNFSYSVGFPKSLGQGEVIVFGLSHSLMHKMINLLWESCNGGAKLVEGARFSGVLEGFEVVARSVARERIIPDFFNSAMWFHRRTFGTELSEAYQIVWPGAQQGLFPWDEGCTDYVISQQPALYKPSIQ
jgi:Domain of unknown function (DUF4262)